MTVYAIHKKLGTIKELPEHAVGWMDKNEWVVFDHFPNKEDYFDSVSGAKELWLEITFTNGWAILFIVAAILTIIKAVIQLLT